MTRLEQFLWELGQRYIRQRLYHLPHDPYERAALIADLLASDAGLLVLRGDFPRDHMDRVHATIANWVNPYLAIYDLLAQTLFPSQRSIHWSLGDRYLPPIVMITGELALLVSVLGRYVVPYVVERQRNPLPQYAAELRGICGYMLDAVGGEDLTQAQYRHLCDALMVQVDVLIQQPIRQRGLTTPAEDLFTQTPSTPMPAIIEPPPIPLPETPSEQLRRQQAEADLTDSEKLRGPHGYPPHIPIFFNGRGNKRNAPPVRRPPQMKQQPEDE